MHLIEATGHPLWTMCPPPEEELDLVCRWRCCSSPVLEMKHYTSIFLAGHNARVVNNSTCTKGQHDEVMWLGGGREGVSSKQLTVWV